MATAGQPLKIGETKPFQITVPLPMYQYLEWLAKNSVYGPNPQDVVVKLLTERINHMLETGYHDKRIPKD